MHAVLDKAAKQAIQLRQNWLGPEHYLLAILSESSIATDAMAELGITRDRVAGHLARMIRAEEASFGFH